MKTFLCFCNENDKKDTDSRNIISTCANIIDKNIRLVKYVSYGLGLTGLLIIGRSIHITKQFQKIQDIPIDFIKKGIKLNTSVKSCDENGVLWVRHYPILQLFKKKSADNSLLPVKVVGLDHTEESVIWLKENVTGNVLWCDVLKVNQTTQHLDSVVYYKMGWFKKKCVNEYLVQQGLAHLLYDEDFLLNQNHDRYDKLLRKLLKAEEYAEKKGKGLWKRPSFREKVKSYPSHLKNNMHNSFSSFILYIKETIFKVFKKEQ